MVFEVDGETTIVQGRFLTVGLASAEGFLLENLLHSLIGPAAKGLVRKLAPEKVFFVCVN